MLLFLDESGDHNLDVIDPQYSIFVLGGCIIALGHPVAASGARILMTLMYELRRQKKELGLAGICSGQSQGDAVLIRIEE